MSDLAPPPEPERKPEPPLDRPVFRLLPEITEQLANPPEPKPERPRPDIEREPTKKTLKHDPPQLDVRKVPTIQGPGMGVTFTNTPSNRTSPAPAPEPQRDPLEEARKRLAEREQKLEPARDRPTGRMLRGPEEGRQLTPDPPSGR